MSDFEFEINQARQMLDSIESTLKYNSASSLRQRIANCQDKVKFLESLCVEKQKRIEELEIQVAHQGMRIGKFLKGAQ